MEKTPNDSKAEVIIRMFPSDANPAGNVFGGAILKHIDMVAGIVAQRFSQQFERYGERFYRGISIVL